LIHTPIALEADSGLRQVHNGCGDLWDLPTQNRAMGWWEFFSHAQTQHDAIGVKDQRERRLFHDQAKAKNISVEIPRAGYVDDGDKSDDVVFAESREL
jgi:hypothetical protein